MCKLAVTPLPPLHVHWVPQSAAGAGASNTTFQGLDIRQDKLGSVFVQVWCGVEWVGVEL